ncbi:hypothetical protein IFR05_015010 [Cadophora sp. M221]|nr:hypothetical protein IFR05_015010 [Cadophora sp. M221]
MSLAIGQTLKGRNASYYVTKVLKHDVAHQAKIISGDQHPPSSKSALAVLKLRPQGREAVMYERERGCYELEGIARSPHIRALLDLIGHDGSEPHASNASRPQSLAVFDDLKGVHNDVNPNNVFVSGANGSQPKVKLGDLGCWSAYPNPRGLEGIGVFHSTGVWGLGVTFTHSLASRTIFEPSDKIIKDMAVEWCLAKIIRLVGPMEQPVRPEYAEEFAMAEYLERETFVHPEKGVKERFIKVGTIREELENIPGKKIENRCLEFIESLLVLDHTKRPTAREALEHPWIRGAEDDID